MATDYDSPRPFTDEEPGSLEELQSARKEDLKAAVLSDEEPEEYVLPDDDLPPAEDVLSERVKPQQPDEFLCANCFLLHHRSQKAKETSSGPICSECAA